MNRKIEYEVDGEIGAYFNIATGKLDIDFDGGTSAKDALNRAWREAWSGGDGSALREKGLESTVRAELAKRYDHVQLYPGIYFRSRVEAVLHDLALVQAPSPKVSLAAARTPEDPEEAIQEIRATRFRESFNRDGATWEIDQFFRNVSAFVSEHKRQPERNSKLEHFAAVVNAQVRKRGIHSITPRDGIVTVIEQGREYDYPYLGSGNFKERYDEALLFDLIQ